MISAFTGPERIQLILGLAALAILFCTLPVDLHERSKQQMQTDLFDELGRVESMRLVITNGEQQDMDVTDAPSDDDFISMAEL